MTVKEEIAEIKEVLCLILNKIRPDGDFIRFDYSERKYLDEKLQKWTEELNKERTNEP